MVQIIENACVAGNKHQKTIGHQRDFTYETYHPQGMTLQHKTGLLHLNE